MAGSAVSNAQVWWLVADIADIRQEDDPSSLFHIALGTWRHFSSFIFLTAAVIIAIVVQA